MLRQAQGGVLHHILGALVDDVGVGLVGGEDAHLGAALTVADQVVESQARRQFALAVLLGNLGVEEAPVPHPAAVIILHLDAVELADGVHLPGEEGEGLTRPLVLTEH